MSIFRFDDISPNTNLIKLSHMTEFLIKNNLFDEIWYCISLFAHDPEIQYHKSEPQKTDLEKERVFPNIFKAFNDYKNFFLVDKFFNEFINLKKQIHKKVKLVSHGLFHIDHRLLTKEVQEVSIMVSCNFVNSFIFVPPFNKFDGNTENICDEQGIKLIKWEDDWLHLKHNKYDKSHEKYYVHTFDLNEKEFYKWFEEDEILTLQSIKDIKISKEKGV